MTMFTCEKCGIEFTEKRSLTRHQKTHVDSSQTYSCGVCGRVQPSRHLKAAHRYSLTCGVCGQYFNILDNLARHRAQHERPAAPESGPSRKQRRTVSPPTNTHQEKRWVAADTEVLPDDPETRALNRQRWQSIRTEEATGNRVQYRYNFTLLRHMETGELRYYHSSQNNSIFFDVPHLIRTEDLEIYLDELHGQDILQYIRQQRPDTKWVVHLLTNVTFYDKLFAEMPPVYKKHRRIQRRHESICRRKGDHEPEKNMFDWKYVWRKDNGYLFHLCWSGMWNIKTTTTYKYQ